LEIYSDAETSNGDKGREFGGSEAEVEGTPKDKFSSNFLDNTNTRNREKHRLARCLPHYVGKAEAANYQSADAAKQMLFDINQICVDLALVERKQPDKRSGDDNPAQSQLYKPDYEETQKLEYEEFLATVLKASPSNKIAIIGEPGAGKTTLLQRIAFWILDNTDGLPIWIPLGNLPTPAPKLKDYLLNNWLEDAILNVTPKIRAEFEELLTAGRVWLLLDGVDEMVANSGNPLSFIDNWIPGWCQQLSVVLTCRLNVWEANPHALNNFQTYRTLEFSQEKVNEFIEACFQNRRGDALSPLH
jgi:predicted NACHT family NTPase